MSEKRFTYMNTVGWNKDGFLNVMNGLNEKNKKLKKENEQLKKEKKELVNELMKSIKLKKCLRKMSNSKGEIWLNNGLIYTIKELLE